MQNQEKFLVQESAETEEKATEKRKKHFFKGIKNKLLVMAAAGFITLGAGWDEALADQLKLKVPKKAGAAPEFILETAITSERLQEFKQKIEKEEPEFKNWIENYVSLLKDQLNNLADSILTYDLKGEDDKISEANLKAVWTSEPEVYAADPLIEKDHKTIHSLQQTGKLLKNAQKVLNDNLNEIIWAIFLGKTQGMSDAIWQNWSIRRRSCSKSTTPAKMMEPWPIPSGDQMSNIKTDCPQK